MDLVKLTTKIIQICFYTLLFLVPLIFIPGHFELFQFNKMILVYLATTTITSTWIIKMVTAKQINIRKTPLDLPLLLFFASQVASTIFSIEPHTSIWGYYSRFHGGLLSTISYILLYYAFVSNFTLEKKLVKNQPLIIATMTLIVSSSLVAFYGILEHFGIDANYWVQDVRNRVFSTIGQPNWLAAFLLTVAPLALFTSIKPTFTLLNKRLSSAAGFFLIAVFYLSLLYTKSRSGLLGFAVMFTVFWLALLLKKLKNKPLLTKIKLFTNLRKKPILISFIISTAILSILSLAIGTPFTPSLRQLLEKQTVEIPNIVTHEPLEPKTVFGGSATGEIRKVVWKGALDVWKNWPIFGSGVETFAYSYYNFRPVEHNYLSEWDFLYNKAHSEHINFLATTGIIGLASYLLIVIVFSTWSLKSITKTNTQSVAFLSGYLGLQVALFFGFSTVTTGLLFFLLPALALLFTKQKPSWITVKFAKKKSLQPSLSKLSLAQLATILLTITAGLFASTHIVKRWYADRLFAEAKRFSSANYMSQAIILEQKTTQLVPDEPLFNDRLSIDLARSAAALKLKGDATSAAQFAALAEVHSNLVVLKNPVHINYLKNRSAVMLHLETVDKSYGKKALETLLLAQQLSPTDPNITYNLGLFYQQREQEAKAIELFQKSINLKPNYELPSVALAMIYEKNNQLEKAIRQYQQLLEYYPEKSQYVNHIRRLATKPSSEL